MTFFELLKTKGFGVFFSFKEKQKREGRGGLLEHIVSVTGSVSNNVYRSTSECRRSKSNLWLINGLLLKKTTVVGAYKIFLKGDPISQINFIKN